MTKRVFPPLNTTDYSSYAQQMPTNVDGTFVAVGGAGLIPFLKAYEQAHGPIDGKKFIGNLFWGTPGEFQQLGTRVSGAYVGGAGTAGDLATPAAKAYNAEVGKVFKTIPPFGAAAPQASSTFTYGYYVNTWGLLAGLKAVGGDISGGQKALQSAIAKVKLATPYGPLHLDANRQAVINVFYQQLYLKDGKLAIRTVGEVPGVTQTFGGTFSSSHAGTGPHGTGLREAEPAVDRQGDPSEGHRLATQCDAGSSIRARRADPPLAGDRPALRRPPRRARRRSRRRARREAGHPRAERRGQDDALQRHLGRRSAELGVDRVPRPRRLAPAAALPGEARDGAHLPEVPLVPRPHGRRQPVSRDPRRADGTPAPGRPPATRRRASRARSRARAHRRPRRARADTRRLALARRAAPARDRHGARVESGADDARRACIGALARRASRADGAPAAARPRRSP